MTNPPKTYVLIGYDNERQYAKYKNRDDCIVIRYDDPQYETFADAVKSIEPPANVILQCHGRTDGKFRWSKSERCGYAELMRRLPPGTLSVTLGSCYGGLAQAEEILRAAPPGMLVMSMTGPQAAGLGSITRKFAEESAGLTRPTDLFLEALDNFNPAEYKNTIEHLNQRHNENDDPDPDRAMPHILGLGGDPPVRVDLKDKIKLLHGRQNDPALKRAVERVQDRFDTDYYRSIPDDMPYVEDGGLGAEAEQSLDRRIATMAQKLASGYTPTDVEERRLAFALTAAYLDESGEMERLRKTIPGYTPVKHNYTPIDTRDAYGNRIPEAAEASFLEQALETPPPGGGSTAAKKFCDSGVDKVPCLTHEEQAYLDSVALKLKDDPEKTRLINELTQNFSETSANDAIPEGGRLDKGLQHKGIHTKSWTR